MILLLPKPDDGGFFGRMSVKISAENVPASLDAIQTLWKKYLPETPYEYTFLDEKYNKLIE